MTGQDEADNETSREAKLRYYLTTMDREGLLALADLIETEGSPSVQVMVAPLRRLGEGRA